MRLVAPYVGAWIETKGSIIWNENYGVAPYVGAWIETGERPKVKKPYMVAPYVGAWIETVSFASTFGFVPSHPMWVRGLKRDWRVQETMNISRTLCGCVD